MYSAGIQLHVHVSVEYVVLVCTDEYLSVAVSEQVLIVPANTWNTSDMIIHTLYTYMYIHAGRSDCIHTSTVYIHVALTD